MSETENSLTEPYFRSTDGGYLPQPPARGPWDPNSLSGSVIFSLLAFEVGNDIGSDEYMPARFTVDMYRLPDFSLITIRTSRVRDGYRIKVIDAEFFSNGKSMARATCQMLRRTENADVRVWKPEPWDVPAPEALGNGEGSRLDTSKVRRPISGNMNECARKRMWISEQRCLVDDIPLSPWLRACMAADLTNPWANSGEGGLGYINSDVTLYLHRVPVDEWVGIDVVNHQATDGVAIGECYLYDRQGMIGSSSVTGLAQRKRPSGG